MFWARLVAAIPIALLVTRSGASEASAPSYRLNNSDNAIQQPDGLFADKLAANVELADQDPTKQSLYESGSRGQEMADWGPETGCCDTCGSEVCTCSAFSYRSGWTLSLEASALQSQMASRDVDSWPHDVGAAGRIALGYEGDSGLGIRAQGWGYSMRGTAYHHYYSYYYDYSGIYFPTLQPLSTTTSSQLELTMASTYLDIYKSNRGRFGEFLLGGGPAFGHLEFNTPPAGDGSKYVGGGVTAFGEGSLLFMQRHSWHLVFTGQTRISLLTGDWHIDPPPYGLIDVESTHSNSMSVLELGIGPELRWRLGRAGNSYCFLRTTAEFQQWTSDRMGTRGGDTLALQGVTISFGANW